MRPRRPRCWLSGLTDAPATRGAPISTNYQACQACAKERRQGESTWGVQKGTLCRRPSGAWCWTSATNSCASKPHADESAGHIPGVGACQRMHSHRLGRGGRRLHNGTEGATTKAAHHGVEPGAAGLPANRRCSKQLGRGSCWCDWCTAAVRAAVLACRLGMAALSEAHLSWTDMQTWSPQASADMELRAPIHARAPAGPLFLTKLQLLRCTVLVGSRRMDHKPPPTG